MGTVARLIKRVPKLTSKRVPEARKPGDGIDGDERLGENTREEGEMSVFSREAISSGPAVRK